MAEESEEPSELQKQQRDIERRVDTALASLTEHVQSARIFITYMVDGKEETFSYSLGKGNFYAQTGQCREWLTKQDEYARENARKHARGTSDGQDP